MKLQSAMEYLITYGWAILIISIVLAALFSLGVFNPSQFAGQECVLSSGFSCLSYLLFPNGTLSLNLLQSSGKAVNITSLGCDTIETTSYMHAPNNPPSNQVYMPIGSNYTFPVTCYSNGSVASPAVSSLFNGYLAVNYTETTTGFPHTIYGRIVVKAS